MTALVRHRNARALAVAAALVASTFAVMVMAALGSAAPTASSTDPTMRALPSATLVSAPPAGAAGPDDLALLPMTAHGPTLLWTAYQNHIGPNGAPGTTGGPYQSTIAGYTLGTGKLVKTINVTGKIDGLGANPATGRLLATVNEDSNSSFYVVNPSTGHMDHFAYSPNVTVNGNGGTDSISMWNGAIIVIHSNPNDTTQATEFQVSLNYTSHVAWLTPLFFDNSAARDALNGAQYHLALTDPDTNFVMPSASHRFAGDLATISQGDGRLIFAGAGQHGLSLAQLNLTDNVSGNVPPIDAMTVATSSAGSLYVVDAGAGTITQLVTDGWPAGTVFVTEPSDNGNPLLGVLNLYTGVIHPFANHFVSPKGIIFVPLAASSGHHTPGDDRGHGDDGQGQNDNGQGGEDGNGQGHEDHNGNGGGDDGPTSQLRGDSWAQFWAFVLNGER